MTAPRSTPNPATTTNPGKSSARVAHKRPLGWLPLALLVLLILLAALIALLVYLANDDDGDDSSQGAGVAASTSTAANPAPASLTVAGTDLLAQSSGPLGPRNGQPVAGTGRVQSVVSDEGFWVGDSATNRVFVFLTPEARKSNGESGFQVTDGQSVQITGELVALADAPSSAAGVTDDEGRSQLVRQAAFVRAETLALGA